MRKGLFSILIAITTLAAKAQNIPCTSDPTYRQFDFWIGEWDVYGKNGKKAGDSRIELILDSCIILENWKSANPFKNLYYAGKSFNTYNSLTKQWQQTWVDNVGGTTEFLEGHYEDNKMIPLANPNLQMRMFPIEDMMNGIGGALCKAEGFYKPSTTDGPLVYLNANPDVQKVLDKIESAGGKIQVPKTMISPEYGHMA